MHGPGSFEISRGQTHAIKAIAPLRTTAERMLRRAHAIHGREVSEPALAADLEITTALLTEAYRRGVEALRLGLHAAEGVDHAMIDQALAAAFEDGGR